MTETMTVRKYNWVPAGNLTVLQSHKTLNAHKGNNKVQYLHHVSSTHREFFFLASIILVGELLKTLLISLTDTDSISNFTLKFAQERSCMSLSWWQGALAWALNLHLYRQQSGWCTLRPWRWCSVRLNVDLQRKAKWWWISPIFCLS